MHLYGVFVINRPYLRSRRVCVLSKENYCHNLCYCDSVEVWTGRFRMKQVSCTQGLRIKKSLLMMAVALWGTCNISRLQAATTEDIITQHIRTNIIDQNGATQLINELWAKVWSQRPEPTPLLKILSGFRDMCCDSSINLDQRHIVRQVYLMWQVGITHGMQGGSVKPEETVEQNSLLDKVTKDIASTALMSDQSHLLDSFFRTAGSGNSGVLNHMRDLFDRHVVREWFGDVDNWDSTRLLMARNKLGLRITSDEGSLQNILGKAFSPMPGLQAIPGVGEDILSEKDPLMQYIQSLTHLLHSKYKYYVKQHLDEYVCEGGGILRKGKVVGIHFYENNEPHKENANTFHIGGKYCDFKATLGSKEYTCATAEGYFQACKAFLMNKTTAIDDIVASCGRQTNLLGGKAALGDPPPAWHNSSSLAMIRAVWGKAVKSDDRSFYDILTTELNNGLKAEHTIHDGFWGDKCTIISDGSPGVYGKGESLGSGENKLGIILMAIRDILQTRVWMDKPLRP